MDAMDAADGPPTTTTIVLRITITIIANACGVGAGAPQMAFDMQRLSHGAAHLYNDPFGSTVSTVHEALRQQF